MEENKIKFKEGDIIVDSEIAVNALKSVLTETIGTYIEGTFKLTSDKITQIIEKNKLDLTNFTEKKLSKISCDFLQTITNQILNEKMSDEIIDNLINTLTEFKKNRI